MTSKEAFEQFTRTEYFVSNSADDFDIWQEACEYQKQKDAEICRQQITGVPLNLVAQGFAEAILNQGDE